MMPFSARMPNASYTACREIVADLGANVLGDVVRRAVRSPRHRPQHRQALSRDLDTVFAKDFGWIVTHAPIIEQFWTLSRISLIPTI